MAEFNVIVAQEFIDKHVGTNTVEGEIATFLKELILETHNEILQARQDIRESIN